MKGRFFVFILILTSFGAFASSQTPPQSLCKGQFYSCYDASTGTSHSFVDADSCVECYNVQTAEEYWYGYCEKDSGPVQDPPYPWDCRLRN